MSDTPKRNAAIGLDIGTYMIQCARRDANNEIEYREEINGFLQVSLDTQTQMMVQMIKDAKAPMLQRGNEIYVLGQRALKIAYAWDRPFRRPMKDGMLSVEEKDAFNILAVMMRSILNPVPAEKTIVVYSSPAAPLNMDKDPAYHQKVLQSIFDQSEFGDQKWKVVAKNVSESQAIVRAELENDENTGIGLSFGAGMVNASFCLFGVPIFEFSLVGSGDWIDKAAAGATGESETYINQEKEKIDLTKSYSNYVEKAIAMHYQILLERVAKGLAEGVKKHKKRTPPGQPCKIIVAGGTATPPGFCDMLQVEMKKQDWGEFQLGDIILAPDHKRTVAKGLLRFAETINIT